MIFLSCSYLTQEQKKTVVDCLVLSGVSIGLAAIYQFFFGFQHTLERLDPGIQYSQFTMEYLCLKRVFFPFVTPNILAGYLAITIPLCLTLKNGKLIALVPFSALCLTRSIGGLLSLLIGLSVYYYLKGINRKVFLGICAVAVISGLIFVWRSTGIHAHIKPFFSLGMRIDYWEHTLRIIREFPLTGIGIGNFNLAASRYAHNSYLQIWAEMGILGLISILWISIDTLKHLFKRIKNPPAKNILYGLAAANLVFLVNNAYSFDFFLPEISLIWWTILGLSRE
jgi:O-antigen ligase